MRRFRSFVVGGLFFGAMASVVSGSEMPAAPPDSHPMADKLFDNAAKIATEIEKHATDPAGLMSYLDSFKKWVDERVAPFKSMLDWRGVERVTDNVKWLRKLNPPKLDSLFSKGNLDDYKQAREPTIVSGAAELRRMQKASDERAMEIKQLKGQRDKIAELRDTYMQAEQTTGVVSQKLGKLLGNVVVEIAVLFEGHSLPMSWYDLSEELRPALAGGANAAQGAMDRIEAEILGAEADLKSFETWRTGLGIIWNDIAPAPGAVSVAELQRKMKQEVEESNRRAMEFRQRAIDIDSANARIDAIKRLLAIGGDLNRLAAAGANWPKSGTNEPSSERPSILIGPDVPPPEQQRPVEQQQSPPRVVAPGGMRL